MARWKLICVLFVAACGLIPASRLVGQNSRSGLQQTELAVFGHVIVPETELSPTFAGLARVESSYGIMLGTMETGTTEYPPGEFFPDATAELNAAGAMAGLVMNESGYGVPSRYAFTVVNNPASLDAASRLVPVDFWRFEGPSAEPPRPTETGRRYGTAVRKPSEAIGFLGDQAQPVVDVVLLTPATSVPQQTVLESLDFSDTSAPQRGGFVSSAYDPARDIAYFGTGSGGAEIAVIRADGSSRSMIGIVPVDLDANRVLGVDVDRNRDRVYVLADSPFRIISLTRATTDTLPVVTGSRLLEPELSTTPESISVDSARGHVFVYARSQSTISCQLGKYLIDEDGSLSFAGAVTIPDAGARLMLHDKISRHLYLFTYPSGGTRINRIDGGQGINPPSIPQSNRDVFILANSRIQIDWGFLTTEGAFAYLYGSPTEGAASRVYRVRVDGPRDLAGAVVGQRHIYSAPSAQRQTPAIIRNMSIYTHGDGGKFRLALYRSNSTNVESGVLIWQSGELESVAGAWTTVPVRGNGGSNLTISNQQRLFLAFQVADEKAQPGHVSRGWTDAGFRLPYQYGLFPVLNDPKPGVRHDRFAMNVDLLFQPTLGQLRVAPNLANWTAPIWIGSPEITFTSTGTAQVMDIGYTPDFSDYDTVPFSNSMSYTIRSEYFQQGATLRLYFRARTEEVTSTTFTGDLQVDTIPPGKPAAPVSVGLDSNDPRRAIFSLPNYPLDQGGSGVDRFQAALGSTPGSEDLQIINGASPGNLVSHQLPLSTTVYCRVRAYDRAGNFGPWSESSEPLYINAPPVTSITGFLPAQPGTLDDVTPIYTVIDPDGDEITAITHVWRRISPLPEITTNSLTLSHTLTTKGENWRLTMSAQDSRGATGLNQTLAVTIRNTLPTQPIVKLVPATPDPNEDLVCDVRVYSFDADGDRIAYDFRWFKSEDGGATFIEKLELSGSPQVSRNFINEGEIWEVSYQPYEVGTTRGPGRVEGPDARDRVYIGRNGLPEFTVGQPFGPIVGENLESHTISVNVFWEFSEPDGEACTVDIYWTDLAESGLVPIAEGLDAELRRFRGNVEIPNNRPIHIHAIITDEKGAIVQRITPPIRIGEMGTTLITY